MRIAYLDCFSGISGDMLLGALADAGAPTAELSAVPEKLGLAQVVLSFKRTERAHIAATKARVEDRAASRHHHRSLTAIEKMIGDADALPERARENAIAVFRRLGEVEARIHGIPLDQVHFHEVGAIDSIIDIVGSCAGFELLGVEKIYCSPLNIGGGSVNTAHGALPVPAPATVDLLKSVCAPVYSAGPSIELVTPTGAAIIAALTAGFGSVPAMKLVASGYGAGSSDFHDRPNALRVLIGEAASSKLEPAAAAPSVCVIEANVDDMSPQLTGHLTERLLELGALDVYYAPVQMKKNRAGLVISVVVDPADRERLAQVLFEETTTIGVRIYTAERCTLERTHVPVDTDYGPIRIKVAREGGRVLNFAPEYEDCRKAALERGVPLKRVLAEANFRYLQKYGKEN